MSQLRRPAPRAVLRRLRPKSAAARPDLRLFRARADTRGAERRRQDLSLVAPATDAAWVPDARNLSRTARQLRIATPAISPRERSQFCARRNVRRPRCREL